MLILNKQVKQAKDIIFNAETTIKNIHKKDNKIRGRNSLRRTLNLLSRWVSYQISKMADILIIGDKLIFDDRVVKKLTHTIRDFESIF